MPTSSRDSTPKNAHSPIDSKEEGIEILVNDEHPKNAYDSIDFTEDGIIISFNNEQSENAYDSILSIKGGIVTVSIDGLTHKIVLKFSSDL